MNYKELIDDLREMLPPKVDYAEIVMAEPVHYGKRFVYGDPESYAIDRAATALETLLAERDALLDELRGDCSTCKHFYKSWIEKPCNDCKREGGVSKNWEWRGPAPDRKPES